MATFVKLFTKADGQLPAQFLPFADKAGFRCNVQRSVAGK